VAPASHAAPPPSPDPVKEACVRASDEGQEARDATRYERARELFRACAATTCPAAVRIDCSNWLGALEERSPTLVLGARDASGADVLDARVEIDGAVVAERLDGRPIRVDPGPHLLRFHARSGQVVEQSMIVRAGEKDRLVVVRLIAPSPAGPEAPAPKVSGSGLAVAGFVVGGTSVALFAAGLTVGLIAQHDLHGIEAQPCAATATCSASAVDAVKTKLVASDILIGASAVGGALAATFLIVHYAGKAPTSVGVYAVPGAGRAEAGLRITY
jgi:hypothetical protein